MTVWFVPRDAAALSVGADAVAALVDRLDDRIDDTLVEFFGTRFHAPTNLTTDGLTQ